MSNEPKCVYIKTDVGYVQITYAEFCRIRNTTENYKASHWFIPVQGVLLEVPKDAYKAFYREKERERYLRKLDSALFLCNLGLKSEEISLRDENTRQGVLKVYGETQRTFNISQAIRGGSSNILKTEVL